jgi:cytochrome c5
MQDQGAAHAHSTPIKTPRQLAVVVLLSFAIPVIGIILLTQFIASERGIDPAALAPEAVKARIQPVARVELAAAAGPRVAQTGEAVYKTVCAACHTPGVAGAPKLGDKAAWAPHIKEGLDELVKNAINGVKAMPPRGGNPNLTDYEVARAVVYMANQSGANFKEPPAPKEAGPAPAQAAAPTPAPPAQVAAAPQAAPPAAAASAANPEQLLQKYACLSCHATDKKVIGPSYKEVAAKYGSDSAAAEKLAQKVKQGGAGVWGQVPMPPNPQVSDADVMVMVKHILAQK